MQKTQQLFMGRAIVEVAGKPKQHIEDTMKLVVSKLRKEAGLKVLKAKVHEPEQHDEVFSTFAEIELRFEDFDSILFFCFEYLPSSIEFLEPEAIRVDSVLMNSVFNELLGRLHQVDVRLKDVISANIILEKNLYMMLKRSVALILSKDELPIGQISDLVGIVPEQLKPFLERFVKEKFIKKSGDNYRLQDGAL